jgi:hypothetical protein
MANNPFYFDEPTEPEDFLGRGATLNNISANLHTWRASSHGIVGGRRIGKSSLLVVLAARLLRRLHEEEDGVPVVPVSLSLKNLRSLVTPDDLFGFAAHRIRLATRGPRLPRRLRPGPVVELGLPDYTQRETTPMSLQGLEGVIEEIVVAADNQGLDSIRIALLVDEIELALGYTWTPELFGNLRSLIYDSDMKRFVSLVLAGSGRYLGVDEKGSPLFNALKGCFLEALDDDGIAALISRASGLDAAVAQAVTQQCGGHPFILQHMLYYLMEQGPATVTLDSVQSEVNHFRLDRLVDLETWWDDIGTDGQRIYGILRWAGDWMTVPEILQAAPWPDLQVERGLRELRCHSFVIHDGTFQKYRLSGELFRDWAAERCQTLMPPLAIRPTLKANLERSSMRRLRGPEHQKFTNALIDAFETRARLTRMVRYRLSLPLAAISEAEELEQVAFSLIGRAEAEGWTDQLLAAARESNPGNPALLEFAQTFGLASSDRSLQELERQVLALNPYLDVALWRECLGQIETQVCRIEIPVQDGLSTGTGFLVGPDLVMTNYHVMEVVILGEQGRTNANGYSARAKDVVLRFDYKKIADDTPVNPGVEFRLVDDWLVDSSPMSKVDGQVDPKQGVPADDELDYALLRVAGAPGNTQPGGKAEPGGSPRKWIATPTAPYSFEAHTPLFIMQHPRGWPLKLALEMDAILGLNENGTRVRYRTNTERGSSGSPCFNAHWELVGLHHSGDPDFDPAHKPAYNEGIPFSKILALLDQRRVVLYK